MADAYPPSRKMSQPNEIKWYKNAAMDASELNSPQPCSWGIFCNYQVVDKTTGERVPGCCRGVHPGEEGTGRRIFPERQIKDRGPDGNGTTVQPRCVRLTGKAGFYERRRLRLSWKQWCEREGIQCPTGSPTPLKLVPFGAKKQSPQPPPRIDLSPESPCEVRLTAYSDEGCSSPCLLSSGATCLLRTEGLDRCCEDGRIFPSSCSLPGVTEQLQARRGHRMPRGEEFALLVDIYSRQNAEAATEQVEATPVPSPVVQNRRGRMPRTEDDEDLYSSRSRVSYCLEQQAATEQVEEATPVPSPVVQKRRGRPPKNKSTEGGATSPLRVLASGGGGSCEEDGGCCTPFPSALSGGGCDEGDMEAQD